MLTRRVKYEVRKQISQYNQEPSNWSILIERCSTDNARSSEKVSAMPILITIIYVYYCIRPYYKVTRANCYLTHAYSLARSFAN